MSAQNKSELRVIFLTVFLYLVGFGVIIPLLPTLVREMGATSFQLGLLMAVYSLNQFLFSPFWGALSDRIGRRPVLLGCLFMEVLCYVVFAFARSIEMLILARALAGFFGASLSTASAAVSDVTGESERSKGMALIGAAFGLGFIFGPGLGGGLSLLGARISDAPFFASTFTLLGVAVLCLVNFLLALRYLRETRSRTELVSAAQTPGGGWRQGARALFDKLTAMRSALTQPVIGVLVLAFAIAATGMSAMESTLALYMTDFFGWGLFEISLGFVYIGVLSTFNQGFLVRKLLPRLGEKTLLRLGLVLLGLSLSLIGLSTNLWMMFIAMSMLSFGHGFVNPSILGSVSLLAKSNEQGRMLGTAQGFAALGRILGPLIGGWAYASLSKSAPYFIAGAMVFGAALLIWVLGEQIPSSARRKPE